MSRRPRRVVATAALPAMLATACSAAGTSAGSGAGAPLPQRTADPALVRAAALPACPPSNAPPAPGGLPGVTLTCLGHPGEVRLSGLRGPAVVNLWWSGCAPCREEGPLLQRLAAAGKGEVTVLGVDVEDPDPGLRFAAGQRLRYPMVSDPHERVKDAGLLPGFPVTYFVDRAGRRVGYHPGAYASAAALRADVHRYLGVDAP